MPYGFPSTPVRWSITPSTWQNAGTATGIVPGKLGEIRSVPGAAAGVASALVIASLTPGAWYFSMSAQEVRASANGAATARRAQKDVISLIAVPLYTQSCMQYQTLSFTLIAFAAVGAAQPPAVTSPEVASDRHITFRILAPKAQQVRLFSSDIFGTALTG